MKKILALLLALCMVFALCACGSSTSGTSSSSAPSDSSAAAGDTIKIGVFEPATGENGAGGQQEVIGIRYANSV